MLILFIIDTLLCWLILRFTKTPVLLTLHELTVMQDFFPTQGDALNPHYLGRLWICKIKPFHRLWNSYLWDAIDQILVHIIIIGRFLTFCFTIRCFPGILRLPAWFLLVRWHTNIINLTRWLRYMYFSPEKFACCTPRIYESRLIDVLIVLVSF